MILNRVLTSCRYTHAIVSRIPSSFVDAIGCSDVVNLSQARKELEAYVEALRSLGVDVIEMAADESLPDCPFVEDTAVVCNGIALLTRPGHPQRAREVFPITLSIYGIFLTFNYAH